MIQKYETHKYDLQKWDSQNDPQNETHKNKTYKKWDSQKLCMKIRFTKKSTMIHISQKMKITKIIQQNKNETHKNIHKSEIQKNGPQKWDSQKWFTKITHKITLTKMKHKTHKNDPQ